MKRLSLLVATIFLGHPTWAETIISHQTLPPNGHMLCAAELVGGSGTRIVISLHNSDGDWTAQLALSGQKDVLQDYFDSTGILNQAKLSAAFQTVSVAGSSFKPDSVSISEMKKSRLDEQSVLYLTISPTTLATDFVQALKTASFEIQSLGGFTGTAADISDFRSCASEQLGVSIGG